jgi:hypothetical protein
MTLRSTPISLWPFHVMPPDCDPGVVPAIHAFPSRATSDGKIAFRAHLPNRSIWHIDVDGRDKPGHDGQLCCFRALFSDASARSDRGAHSGG